MLCPKCQQKNSKTARFCQNCGESLIKIPFIKRHKGCLILSIIFLTLSVFLIFIFINLLGFLTSFSSSLSTQRELFVTGTGENKIALLNIDGIILEKEPSRGISTFTEEYTSSRRIKKILNEISQDEKVKALLLRINSPGGSAVAAEEIYQEFLNFKKTKKIPIVTYYSDLAASGGYYVSLASDKIIANPSSITGSIGVMISYLNFSDLASKYGVKNIIYKSGPYKDILSEFREPTKEEKEIMQNLVFEAHEVFIKAVAEGRKLTEEKVKALADGRVYTARQAKYEGLIDEIGSFEEAISLTKKIANLKEAKVVEFGQPTIWEVFLGNLLGKFSFSLLPPGLNHYFDLKPGMQILYLYNP